MTILPVIAQLGARSARHVSPKSPQSQVPPDARETSQKEAPPVVVR